VEVSYWLPIALPLTAIVLGIMMLLRKRGRTKQAQIAGLLGILGFIVASLLLYLPCVSGDVTYDTVRERYRGCESWQFAIVFSFWFAALLSVLILGAAMIWAIWSDGKLKKET
jgi:4-amino-4-deoxy-L-arabinose transferase-like glycosyltransferase